MNSRWFRFYEEVLNDPKVQQLPGDIFKAWVNMLCLASQHDGVLPDIGAISFALRIDEKKTKKIVADFVARTLLDETADGIVPHGWSKRQYKSDVSTDRVKQHRERKRNVSPPVTGNVSKPVTGNVSRNVAKGVSRNASLTVSETPPDTETDTDTEVESYPGRFGTADLRDVALGEAAEPPGEEPSISERALAAMGRGRP